MTTRQTKFWMGAAFVVVLGGVATAFMGLENWWVLTAIGLSNLGVCTSNYVKARRRERSGL